MNIKFESKNNNNSLISDYSSDKDSNFENEAFLKSEHEHEQSPKSQSIKFNGTKSLINPIISVLSKSETQNQISKALQCICRILGTFTRTSIDKNFYYNLSDKICIFRKIFRVFRFLNEIPRMKFLIFEIEDFNIDGFSKNINFMSRLFNFFFYVLENANLIMVLGFFDEKFSLLSEALMGFCFGIAQLSQIAYYIYVYNKICTNEKDINSNFKLNFHDIYSSLKQLNNIKKKIILGLIKCIGELFISFNDMKLFKNAFGDTYFQFLTSLTGLFSSLISLWFLKED